MGLDFFLRILRVLFLSLLPLVRAYPCIAAGRHCDLILLNKKPCFSVRAAIFYQHSPEVKLGAELGRGEFGTVFEINCLVIIDEYAGLGGVESKKEICDTNDFKGLSDDVNAKDSNKPIATEHMGASTRGLSFCSLPSSSQPSLNPQLGVSPPSSNMPADITLIPDPTPAADEPNRFKHDQSFFLLNGEDTDQELEQHVMLRDPTGMNLKRSMSQLSQRNGMARYALKRITTGPARHKGIRDEAMVKDWTQEAVKDLACEAKFLQSLHHPNIIRLRGTMGTPGDPDFGLVLDRMSGTLRDKIRDWKRIREGASFVNLLMCCSRERAYFCNKLFLEQIMAVFDIARGMKYLHSKRVIYRDLKPGKFRSVISDRYQQVLVITFLTLALTFADNIGFHVRGDVRIFDFGLAKELRKEDLVQEPDGYRATGLTGTRRYMAPEVVLCKPYGPPSDVFSFSILGWQVFSLKTPFQRMNEAQHTTLVARQGRRPSRLQRLPTSLRKLLTTAWSAEPNKRPQFDTICSKLKVELMHTLNESEEFISDRTYHLNDRSFKSLFGVGSRF